MEMQELVKKMIEDYENMRNTIETRLKELYSIANSIGIRSSYSPTLNRKMPIQEEIEQMRASLMAKVEENKHKIMQQAEMLKSSTMSAASPMSAMRPMFDARMKKDEEK